MSASSPDPSSPHTPERHPHYSRGTLWLLATIAGVSVANIYFNQPLLGDFRAAFPESAWLIGAVPAATQLGYALGMLVLAPLGDRFDRRLLILLQLAALGVSLVVACTAPTLAVLIAASLAIGVVSTIAQQAVPFSAELAPAAERGHAVGTVMSGLLLGILLARTASGFIAQYFGWRSVFAASIAAMAALAALVATRLRASGRSAKMRVWFAVCADCSPISRTITPITSPAMLLPENANTMNETATSAMASVTTARGPRRSANRPAQGAASTPATPTIPNSPAACGPRWKGGPASSSAITDQKRLKAANSAAPVSEAARSSRSSSASIQGVVSSRP